MTTKAHTPFPGAGRRPLSHALTLLMLLLPVALYALTGRTAQAWQVPQVVGFIINEDGNSITVIEPATGQVLATHDYKGVLNKPHLAAYDRTTKRLYVGNKGANFVVLDMSDAMSPKVIANVKPGGDGEIHRVVIAGGLVWLAHQGDSAVYAYDPANLSAPAVMLGKDKGFDTTHGLTLRPGTDELWSTNRPTNKPGFVLRVDARTRSVVGKPLPTTGKDADRPNNVEFTPDGKWAYVANTGTRASQVTVIDAERFEVVKQIEQDTVVGMSPHAVTYEPVSGRIFTVNMNSGTLTAIRPRDNFILGYFSIGAEPHAVAAGPDGRLYATAKRDGKVVVLDSWSYAKIREITGLAGPHQILFTAPAPAPQPVAPAAPAAPAAAPAELAPPAAPLAAPASEPVTAPQSVSESAPQQQPPAEAPGMPRTGGNEATMLNILLALLPALVLMLCGGLTLARVSARKG